MKAYIVFVKKNELTGKISDVIIIENKLSSFTDFTKRQKEGWKKIAKGEKMKVKYERRFEVNDLRKVLEAGEELEVDTRKVFKISDHGEAKLSETTLSEIIVNDFIK